MTSCKLTFVNVIEFSLILLPIVSDFVILSGAFVLKLGLHHLDEMFTLLYPLCLTCRRRLVCTPSFSSKLNTSHPSPIDDPYWTDLPG